MSWRSAIVYWVLALAVGGHLYTTLRARGPIVEGREQPGTPIVEVPAASIEAISARSGAASIELRRDGDRWTLVEPAGGAVSSDLVDALLDTLTTIPPVEILDVPAGGQRASQFGLDPPRSRLELASAAGRVATVELGQRNPTRTAVYARLLGEDRLYLLGLNAQYYVELLYEQLQREGGAVAGVPTE